MLACCQDEYTAITGPVSNADDLKQQYNISQRLAAGTGSPRLDTRLQQPLHNVIELSSSVPYGLNSPLPAHRMQQLQLQQPQRGGQLLQHSHSLPSSPRKVHSHVPVQCAASVYHAGSFTEMYGNMVEKTTTSRSKVLPKEVHAVV